MAPLAFLAPNAAFVRSTVTPYLNDGHQFDAMKHVMGVAFEAAASRHSPFGCGSA
jgi:hypothetical protein